MIIGEIEICKSDIYVNEKLISIFTQDNGSIAFDIYDEVGLIETSHSLEQAIKYCLEN